jgi:hypothetical protein
MASIKDRLATLPELTETQKETISKKAEVGQAFIDGVKGDRLAKPSHEDPAYNLD